MFYLIFSKIKTGLQRPTFRHEPG